jgi:hypothetical protein
MVIQITMPTKEERSNLKKQYRDLLEGVSKILFEEDPVGLNFGDNYDEYDTEASTILPRLRHCGSADDTRNVIYEEFCRWFDVPTAGSIERYARASARIWKIWKESGIG